MKKILLLITVCLNITVNSQPVLINTSAYSIVSSIAYDSISNKIYYNVTNGCPTWNTPCAYSYSVFGMHNLINKHSFENNPVVGVIASKHQVATPTYPVNNYNSALSRQCLKQENALYTNFGYYFTKVDTALSAGQPLWSYSPAINASFKEISTFEVSGDSVFLFQKDSTSGNNYYSLLLKNKYTGSDISFNSLLSSSPSSSMGCIEGHIRNSVIAGSNIVLSGVFTASISGVFIARNIIALNIQNGQLQSLAPDFQAGSAVYDMKKRNGRIYVAGQFSSINGITRNNYAVFDFGFNLLSDTMQFEGTGAPSNTWVDKIDFYDNNLIAKGNFNKLNSATLFPANNYCVKIVDLTTGNIKPWNINLPGMPVISDYTFEMIRHKLFIKNRNSLGSPFHIYCFEPVRYSLNIPVEGSVASSSVNICVPDTGSYIFSAPVNHASTYNWVFSGSNATIIPIGNGNKIKLVSSANSSSGILSVTGTNDCGLFSSTATVSIVFNPKPQFTLPVTPQNIICNPDSTLLQGASNSTNTFISWRKSTSSITNAQPYYAKTPGVYFMIITDINNGCKDSGIVQVNENKVKPNSKILSHLYQGVSIPIDTVTCLKPIVTITAGSDTSGVAVFWKSITTNSVFMNPLTINTQDNFKVIAERLSNNCVDSSLIVLVGQNKTLPTMSLNSDTCEINCSIYTATLNASFSPSNCTIAWYGPLNFNANNPAIVTSAGSYTVKVNDPLNGCQSIDSVTVFQSNKLLLNSSNDTVICKNSTISLNSSVIGTLSGVFCSWSNGAISLSTSVNPTETTIYTIQASTQSGCFGTDTIRVTVPPDIQDSTVTYRSCSNNTSGSIAIFAKGGTPPYRYSIDNGNTYYINNLFNNVLYGTYQTSIKDSLGCKRDFSVVLSPTDNLPTPKFLANSLSAQNDTLVLVDISFPSADSIKWILPSELVDLGGGPFTRIVTCADTGTFLITLRSFYGTCTITTNKVIRFGGSDSLSATLFNNNGIKSFSIYPNPNSGLFNVSIEFYKKQNASLQIWGTNLVQHYQQNFYDTDVINHPINVSWLINGNYFLRLIGEFDSRSKPFLINKP